MRTPLVLLKAIGKAVLNYVGAGVLGDILVDALPEIANNVMDEWTKEKDTKERLVEVEAVAQATGKQLAEAVEQVIREVAAGASPDVREALKSYLRQVPGEIRRTLRRPADPTGTTVPAGLVLRKGSDLLPFLPTRVSRFKPGDRPLAGVDLVLDEFLGAGGFGEVWKAQNPDFEGFAPVALKFCLDPQTSRRLLTHQAMVESQVLKQGRHPGIVELQATYLSADPPCLQYEYVGGSDLAGLIQEWHRQSEKPTPIQAAKVVHRLSEIVGYAHRLNPKVVHRDLKPSNILTWRAGSDGAVQFKIADFGIGAVVSDQIIRVMNRGMSVGARMMSLVRGSCTPLYASPDQLHGADPDPRDDVHALGVIWYQIMKGDLTKGPRGIGWMEDFFKQGMPHSMIDLLGSCFEDADRCPADAGILAEKLGSLLRVQDGGGTTSGAGSSAVESNELSGRPSTDDRVAEPRLAKDQKSLEPSSKGGVEAGKTGRPVTYWSKPSHLPARRLYGTFCVCIGLATATLPLHMNFTINYINVNFIYLSSCIILAGIARIVSGIGFACKRRWGSKIGLLSAIPAVISTVILDKNPHLLNFDNNYILAFYFITYIILSIIDFSLITMSFDDGSG